MRVVNQSEFHFMPPKKFDNFNVLISGSFGSYYMGDMLI